MNYLEFNNEQDAINKADAIGAASGLAYHSGQGVTRWVCPVLVSGSSYLVGISQNCEQYLTQDEINSLVDVSVSGYTEVII